MADNSSETNIPLTEWSLGSLKAFHDNIIQATERIAAAEIKRLEQSCSYEREISDERDKRYDQRFKAQEDARAYAQEKQNEFREALDDVSTKQATQISLNAAVISLKEKIDSQDKMLAELRSRLDVGNPLIGNIQQQLAANQGMRTQSDLTKADMFKYISAAVAILGAIVLLSNGVLR